MNHWQTADRTLLLEVEDADLDIGSDSFFQNVSDVSELWSDMDDEVIDEDSLSLELENNNLNIADHKLLSREQELELATSLQSAFRRLQQKLAQFDPAIEALSEYIADGLIVHKLEREGSMDIELLVKLDAVITNIDAIKVQQLLIAKDGSQGAKEDYESSQKDLVQALAAIDLDRGLILDIVTKVLKQNDPYANERLGKLQYCYDRVQQIRNMLTTSNVRLVYHIASKHKDKGLEFDDMVQEGVLGLLRAAVKYDVTVGVRFSTYAYWWIQQAIRLAIVNQRSLIRYPNHVATQVNRLYGAVQEIKKRGVTKVSAPELAEATGFSEAKIQDLYSLTNLCLSANTPVYEDGDATLQDLLPSGEVGTKPDANVELAEQVASVRAWLDRLPPRSAKIIAMKYGIGHRKAYSLNDIAPQVGVSRERVRQIIQEAFTQFKRQSVEDRCPLAEVPTAKDLP